MSISFLAGSLCSGLLCDLLTHLALAVLTYSDRFFGVFFLFVAPAAYSPAVEFNYACQFIGNTTGLSGEWCSLDGFISCFVIERARVIVCPPA